MAATMNPATLISRRFDEKDIPDLSGRVAIVTGGSAGIGYWDALALAHHGARVLIISSQHDKCENAASEMNKVLQAEQKKGSVEFETVDLGDLHAVDTLCKKLVDKFDRLDLFFANAGIGCASYGKTKDGLPNHFAINNLSYYVMALRLLPLMQETVSSGKAAPRSVRIIFQSSDLHRMAPSNTKFKDLAEVDEPNRDVTQLYGRSKLGMIVFAKELARRKLSPSHDVLAISVHPGMVDTDIQNQVKDKGAYGIFGHIMEPIMRGLGKSAQEGAEASLWAATCPEIDASFQGKYFSEPYGTPDKESTNAMDNEAASNIYELCSKITKNIIGEDLY